MKSRVCDIAIAVALAAAPALMPGAAQAEQEHAWIVGKVSVADDGALQIGPLTVRLHGIQDADSAQLAAYADGRIVECRTIGKAEGGGLAAMCFSAGSDLGAVLVTAGAAMASDPAYIEHELIARTAGRGMWAATDGPSDGARLVPILLRPE